MTLEELEELLVIKRRQVRQQRLHQLGAQGRVVEAGRLPTSERPARASTATRFYASEVRPLTATSTGSTGRTLRDRVLLGIEVMALAGLLYVFASTFGTLRTLNQEVTTARAAQEIAAAPTPTPLVHFDRLPGGHTPPGAAGGTMPDIPAHLQQWVQPAPPQPMPTPAVEAPSRIVIPRLAVDAPIVHGVTWEDLKKGVGHLPGSAHPGERGNMYLAAHNDIFGEIFRDLERLEVGDEFFVYSGSESFRYVVTSRRIIDPTDVSVMYPSTEPIATLQTCYPYLVNSHRLVVIGELAR
jgi:sortase A